MIVAIDLDAPELRRWIIDACDENYPSRCAGYADHVADQLLATIRHRLWTADNRRAMPAPANSVAPSIDLSHPDYRHPWV